MVLTMVLTMAHFTLHPFERTSTATGSMTPKGGSRAGREASDTTSTVGYNPGEFNGISRLNPLNWGYNMF